MVLGLVKRFDGEAGERKPAGFADEGLQDTDNAVVVGVVELDLLHGQFAGLGLSEDGLGERGVEPVKVRLAGTAREFIKAQRYARGRGWKRAGVEAKGGFINELGMAA